VTRRTLGLALMVAGGVVVVVALIGMLTGGGASTEAGATSTSTTTISAATTAATTTAATTTAATTTPTMTILESTTTGPTTTTTVQPDAIQAIETFVPEFAGMIAAGDVQGLFDTLHPAVLDAQDADLCKTYIEREILALVDYRLTGAVTGPVPTTFGSTTIDLYSGPVSFSYQGEAFDSTAAFGLVNGDARWFTTCR